jgi:hypothetical protein
MIEMSTNNYQNGIKTLPTRPAPRKDKKRVVWAQLDDEQLLTIERAMRALPEKPSLAGWAKRILLREARRVLAGHID